MNRRFGRNWPVRKVRRKQIILCVVTLMLALSLVWMVSVFITLFKPLGQPNGFQRLVTAGETVRSNLPSMMMSDERFARAFGESHAIGKSESDRRPALNVYSNPAAPVMISIRAALEESCRVPIGFSPLGRRGEATRAIKSLAALTAFFRSAGQAAVKEGNSELAVQAYLDAVRVRLRACSGGEVTEHVDAWFSAAHSLHRLGDMADRLTREQCESTLTALEALPWEPDPFELIARREVWIRVLAPLRNQPSLMQGLRESWKWMRKPIKTRTWAEQICHDRFAQLTMARDELAVILRLRILELEPRPESAQTLAAFNRLSQHRVDKKIEWFLTNSVASGTRWAQEHRAVLKGREMFSVW